MENTPRSRRKKPRIDLIGHRYADCVVVEYAGYAGSKHRWRCLCDCGVGFEVVGHNLRSGITKSCGCRKRRNRPLLTHGLTNTRAHGIWKAAKQRCFNANAHNYRHYGGRGVTMCDRWRDSFQAFFDDMGECPDGMSLERIDHNGDYEPGNCRWATQAEQVRNTRRNLMVEHAGRVMTAKDYARETGAIYSTLCARLRTGREAGVRLV